MRNAPLQTETPGCDETDRMETVGVEVEITISLMNRHRGRQTELISLETSVLRVKASYVTARHWLYDRRQCHGVSAPLEYNLVPG
ncbi:hypothetical protein RRG08_029134 [Elysia crispata]|uniref:Uncharacterized protein n=1 Tax=Elysia crispata TaxID=231223 RepID=A0AAE0Y6Q2_9GAST|nr:hypothetical protein RRG08_029134 [Elysia crispata]